MYKTAIDELITLDGDEIPIYANIKSELFVNSKELNDLLGVDWEHKKELYDYFDLLIIAMKLRFSSKSTDIKKALKILEIASSIESTNTEHIYLREAVWESLINAKNNFRKNEFDLHEKFKKEVRNLIPNAKIINKKNNKKHIPDFWVNVNDEEMPVEIKFHKFDYAALRQLQRYINFYECNKGYAVAPKLTCNLPSNIKFIYLTL